MSRDDSVKRYLVHLTLENFIDCIWMAYADLVVANANEVTYIDHVSILIKSKDWALSYHVSYVLR